MDNNQPNRTIIYLDAKNARLIKLSELRPRLDELRAFLILFPEDETITRLLYDTGDFENFLDTYTCMKAGCWFPNEYRERLDKARPHMKAIKERAREETSRAKRVAREAASEAKRVARGGLNDEERRDQARLKVLKIRAEINKLKAQLDHEEMFGDKSDD